MTKLVFTITFASLLAHAELNLITGAPTPKGADYITAALWEVNANGALTHVTQLVTKDEGLHRLDMMPDDRVAVLMTKSPKLRVAVLDLDTRSVTKSCVIPKGVYEWASRDPLRYNIYLYLEKVVLAFDLTSSSLNCRQSIRPLAPAEYSLPATYGHAGVDQLAAMETLDTSVDIEGRIQKALAGTSTYLGYSIPERFLKKSERPNGALLTNTPVVLAYKIAYRGEASRILVLHKPSSRWTELPTTNYAGLRVFGKLMVITDGHLRSEQNSKLPAAQREVSPGAEEWRVTESNYGRNTDFFLRNSSMVYGGALHVFDAETGSTRTIRTRQADSEVVLIEGKDVYYRVSDRLYHAVLGAHGIVDEKVIAKSEVIRDAHWAFLSKEGRSVANSHSKSDTTLHGYPWSYAAVHLSGGLDLRRPCSCSKRPREMAPHSSGNGSGRRMLPQPACLTPRPPRSLLNSPADDLRSILDALCPPLRVILASKFVGDCLTTLNHAVDNPADRIPFQLGLEAVLALARI